MISGGAASYFLTDHLGTTRVLADASGSATANIGHDSFGNVNAGSAPTRYSYTGREFDPETGLLYYRARWYDPQFGRFIGEDPIGFEGGINFYAYVDNRPLTYRDPSGLQKKPEKYHGSLNDLCQTDDCKELLNDILILEISLYMRDYVEREGLGGKLDPKHERRINDEDAKLEECWAKYLLKCRDCNGPKSPRRVPNRETSEERRTRETSEHHRNIAIGVTAAGIIVIAGVVGLGGAAGALVLAW